MMKAAEKYAGRAVQGWILFFYTVPSKPVSNRMKVWRRLLKAGAVQLKGAVYILPFTDEHYEFFQWLVSEITGMKGEAAFVRIEHIDTMQDAEIIALFDRQRADAYRALGKELDELERRLGGIRQGGNAPPLKGLSDHLGRLLKESEELKRIDFFSFEEGKSFNERLGRVGEELRSMAGMETKMKRPLTVVLRSVESYQGRVWVTRKKPFIDRMASAWLIRRFIDREASFEFIDEKDLDSVTRNSVAFDMPGGEFTHTGDLCTFETLVRSFGLKERNLRRIAELVHDLDMKDDKYQPAEAKGVEEILVGICKTAKDDREALEKGIQIFEMLYASTG